MFSSAYISSQLGVDKSKADLEKFFNEQKIDEITIAKLLIVIDEVVSNIVNHNSSTRGIFIVGADIKDKLLTLKFTDNGKKFNPLEKDEPDVKKSLKERSIGGLGILIVKKIADSLSYEYKDDCNVLTFTKSI